MLSVCVFAQNDADVVVDTAKVYTFVEQMPEYVGGAAKMLQAFNNSFHYPQQCIEYNIPSGKTKLKFIVERDGSISNIEVIDLECPFAKDALIKSVQNFRFYPGKQNSIAVRTEFIFAVYICSR